MNDIDKQLKKNVSIVLIFVTLIIVVLCIIDQSTFNQFKQYQQRVRNRIFEVCQINEDPKHYHPEQYNSSEGMLTSVWGSALWHVLHTISFNYKVNPTNEDKMNYKIFIESLQHVLPCKFCRDNFTQNLLKLPLTNEVLSNRESFSRWLYQQHNMVNLATGKQPYKSYEYVRDYYEAFRAKNCGSKQFKTLEGGCIVPKYKKQKCTLIIQPE